MERTRSDVIVTLSVVDRLIDQEPRSSAEAPLTRAQSVRRLKEGVRRDLEWLLNTRRVAVEPDESLVELNESLYLYGLPDLSSYSASSSKDQTKLLRAIQSIVKEYEPRLTNVRVEPQESSQTSKFNLRLRIEGILMMDPSPEHVSFDTLIELKSGACQIKGEADAG
ncbi:MAG TPA: type VI secretion system baseplate subunit TssE [Terriglobia bacterium]|nr:type VI secretion system baseplate subunit TssE [Terriglobia bacterium]